MGQSAQTRAQNLIAQVESKVGASANKYNDARSAMVELGTLLKFRPTWQHTLRRLDKEDIRHLSEATDGNLEGRRKPSWIWMTQGVAGKEGDDDDAGLQEGTLLYTLSLFRSLSTVAVLQAQSGFTCIISQIPFSDISSLSLPLLVSQISHCLILVIGADLHTQPWLSHRTPIPEIPTERYQQPANKTVTESKESPDAT